MLKCHVVGVFFFCLNAESLTGLWPDLCLDCLTRPQAVIEEQGKFNKIWHFRGVGFFCGFFFLKKKNKIRESQKSNEREGKMNKILWSVFFFEKKSKIRESQKLKSNERESKMNKIMSFFFEKKIKSAKANPMNEKAK
ncbi:hypothetical protein Glove_228g77 [Diversispora epigaea]|uniref:Uncharacterized protein n=1 Tax=Diversispora epigaea TaxID=1348612 RepID=A0A397IMG5_9GLOM|nr:hypothetical protein Glove_228g77 [Diversispora epigaea]